MSIKRACVAKLMGCACITALLPAVAFAQDAAGRGEANAEDIIVTGSRVITNGTNSPTPVTAVTTEQLQATTPGNIYDALQKLPSFVPFGGQRVASTGGANQSGNYLNLRSLGPQRLLVLLDGHRLPPTAANGAVDTNILPQMLIERVEVVTGGASAVYGSDAVSGVVNYVIDRDFNGVKVQAQKGISERGDNPTFRAGIAAGTDLFGGRGHIEASFEHYYSGGIDSPRARRYGPEACTLGAGTAAQPYVVELTPCRNGRSSYGGAFEGGPLNLMGFNANRQLVPFNPGTPLDLRPYGGTSLAPGFINIGGEGASLDQSLLAGLKTDQAFGRFDFDISDDLSFYLQGSYTHSLNDNDYVNVFITPQLVNHDNAFLRAKLTPAQLALLDASPATSSRFHRIVDDAPDFRVKSTTETVLANAGLTGNLAGFRWDVSYLYSQTKQNTAMVNNLNAAKFMAATDAVLNPANGQIVCRATLTNPGLYPNCQPLDVFGPVSTTPAAWDSVRERTSYLLTSTMHDVAGSISGTLLDNWAGPVRVALSGEYRHNSVTTVSNAPPAPVNCTGLTMTSCGTGLFAINYVLNTVANTDISQSVYEGALEANIPLLRDFVLAKSLDLNLAGRFTHYSTSGNVKTWKVGVDWHLTDDLRFRGTISRDIRAPTLYDLGGPSILALGTYVDLHTGVNSGAPLLTGPNPDLVPEKADTKTVGLVYRPSWLPGFSVAIDYYEIKIGNAIASLNGVSQIVQQLCEDAGGTGPYCSLYVRPFPFSNRGPENYPTRVLSQPVNIANTKTHGVDGEVNYTFDGLGGTFNLRGLVSYQPRYTTVQFTNQPTIEIAGTVGSAVAAISAIPTWRVAAFIGYDMGSFSINTQTRWRSKVRYNKDARFIYSGDATVSAVSYTDLSLTYRIPHDDRTAEFFITVQNLFDKHAPLFTGAAATTSLGVYPALPADDVIGRHFTAGFRVRF